MIYLGLLVLIVLGFRSWKHVQRLEMALQELTARIGALEHRPPAAAQATRAAAPATAPGPAPASAPTAAPLVQSPVASPTPHAAPAPPATIPTPPSVASRAARPEPVEGRAAASTASRVSRDSLEARIGSRWLLYIGVVAVVIGISYFEKLAIDNNWISETVRVLQGAVIGSLLVYGGLRFVKAGYDLYGQIVTGGGIAVLYVSIYAAFNFYHLVGWPVAFVVTCGITSLGAWLSDRLRSQGLALMAVGGGFATPFLISTGTDAQIALFSYDAVLIAGTMYLARRRDWPGLNLASYCFTLLTVAGWASAYYQPSRYLSTELFITLFCGMFLYVLRQTGRPASTFARLVHDTLWTAPVLYYLTSLAILLGHPLPFLLFIILLSLTGAMVAAHFRSDGLGLLFLVAVQAPLLVWIDSYASRTWLVAGLTTVSAVYAINLLSQRHRLAAAPVSQGLGRESERIGDLAIWWLHLNGLAAFGGAYLLIEAVRTDATGPLALAFALWQAACALWLNTRNRPLAMQFVALGATLLAIGVALQLDGAWVTVAWAAEGAAIVWLALREERNWLRLGGVLLFLVAIGRLISLLFASPRVDQILLLNRRAACAAFVIALTYLLTWLHHRRVPRTKPVEASIGLVTGKLLILVLAASEIISFQAIHGPVPFEPAAQLIMASSVIGGTIVWLGLLRREEWAHVIGVVAVALSALALLGMQPADAPAAYQIGWNGRAWAGVVVVGVFYALAAIYRARGAYVPDLRTRLGALLLGASFLTLTTLSSEITAYWHVRDLPRDVPVAEAIRHHFARHLMLSVTWAVYATALIVAGFRRRYSPIRHFAIAVFAVTIAKVFLVDLAELERIYRVASIVALGVMLLVTSYLYTRFKATLSDGIDDPA